MWKLHRSLAFIVLLVGALALAGCGDDDDIADADPDEAEAEEAEPDDDEDVAETEDWPTEPIRFIASTAVGGGTDQLARALQAPLEDALGVPVIVDNRPGGNFSVTPTILHQEGGDCDPIMVHMSPFLEISYLTQEVDYSSYEDFVTIVGLTQEPSILYVREDAPWQTIEELIEHARENPGELTAGVTSATDHLYFALQQIEEQLDVDFTIVPYEGGGPTRTALLAGEIDFTYNFLMTSAGILDEIRILGLGTADYDRYVDMPELDGVPEIDEVLGIETMQAELTFNAGASRECYENHPERYERLQEAFFEALESDAFRGLMEETGQEPWPDPVEGHEYDETVYAPSHDLLRELFDEAGQLVE